MPTTIIILIVIAINIYIAWFSSQREIIGKILTELWHNRLGITLLAALYYIFWHVGQGQDLLMNVNVVDIRVFWLFFTITIFAVLTWYMPRLIHPQNIEVLRELWQKLKSNKSKDNTNKSKVKKATPTPMDILIQQSEKDNFIFNNHYKEQIETRQQQIINVLPEKDTTNAPLIPEKQVQKIKNKLPEQITRLIGTISIFVMAGAVLNIYLLNTKCRFPLHPYLSHVYLIVVTLAAIISINIRDTIFYDYCKSKTKLNTASEETINKLKKIICFSIIILGIIAILAIGYYKFRKHLYGLEHMPLLVLSLTILGFLFLFITTIRRKSYFIVDFEIWIRHKIFKNRKWLIAQDGGMLFIFVSTLCFIVISYILITNLIILPIIVHYFAIPVILLSLGFYYILFTSIEFFSRYKNVPFLFMGILLFALINVSNNAHNDVRVDVSEKNSIYSKTEKRPSFEKYFNEWVNARDSLIDSTSTYPVYIVAAEGGGSRAGFWTSYVLSQLEDETKGEFSKHVFGMTGASGGQVGMTMFNSIIKAQKDRKIHFDSLAGLPMEIYNEDFISYSLLFFLGRDFWQSFNYHRFYEKIFTWSDRAERVEREWAKALSKQLSPNEKIQDLDKPFLSFWYNEKFEPDSTYQYPLLFMNSNHVETGARGIVSPVQLDGYFVNSLDLLDTIALKKKGTIRKNTAALLGARFPFVSPSGRVVKGYHFNDAGYYDNTGGITALEIYRACKTIANASSNPKMKYLDFRFIVIRNDKPEKEKDNKDLRNISELTVPLVTTLQTRNANTTYFYEQMKAVIGADKFYSIDVLHNGDIHVPVSRYLTTIGIKEMKTNYKKGRNKAPTEAILESILVD